jgi:hypothetical protein
MRAKQQHELGEEAEEQAGTNITNCMIVFIMVMS